MNVGGLERDLQAIRDAIRESKSNRKLRTILAHWLYRTQAALNA
jgi:hypothetical protein